MTTDIAQFFSSNSILITLLAVWSIPWKGVALWKSAQRREKWWFIIILIANTAGILEIIYIFFFANREKVKNSLPLAVKAGESDK